MAPGDVIKVMLAASLLLCCGAIAIFSVTGDNNDAAEDDHLGLFSHYHSASFTLEAGETLSVGPLIGNTSVGNMSNYIGPTSSVPNWVTPVVSGFLYLDIAPPINVSGTFVMKINVKLPGPMWTTDNLEWTITINVLPSTAAFNITYNANGGTGSMAPTPGTALDMVTISGNGFTAPAAHTFFGWNTRSDGSGQWFTPGDQFIIINNLSLFARWVFVSPPSAAFVPSANGLTVSFTNTSVLADSYSWNFGDGSTSTLQNPVHTFPTSGSFIVSLTVTGIGGTDTKTTQVIVSSGVVDPPRPMFLHSVNELMVSFTYTGTPATSFLWDFGDGSTSTLQNPVHVFSGPGVKVITLQATNAGGTATYVGFVAIDQVVAGFMRESKGLEVSFYSTSFGSIEHYHWDFGDGSTSENIHPVHIYESHGKYEVSLTVTGITGATDTYNMEITVYDIGADGFLTDPIAWIIDNPWTVLSIILLVILSLIVVVRII